MKSGASLTVPIFCASFVQSESLMLPVRMWCIGTCASADSSRMTISLRLISREKITLVSPCLMDAARHTSIPRVDFPIDGRAARITSCPGCSPLVRESRSVNPVGTPTISPSRLEIASISVSASFITALRGR